jgi:hypothetical protein
MKMARNILLLFFAIMAAEHFFMTPTQAASYPSKTVTWGDGTSDTLQVDDKGQVFLNGQPTIAFGFHIVTGLPSSVSGVPVDSEANQIKMLDTLQSWGVRFMSLDLSSWLNMAQSQAWIDWWMPQLYAHKMFVEFAMQEQPAGDLNVAAQYNRFSQLIDSISDTRSANMIYAAAYAWELDLSSLGHNATQLETYLSSITPQVKAKLALSLIGNVPLVCKMVSPQSTFGSDMFFKYCDPVGYDYYLDPTNMPAHTDERFVFYRQRNEYYGKSDYSIWLQENGVLPEYGANWHPYSPQAFQTVLNGGSSNLHDVSELMLWCLNWDSLLLENGTPYQFPAFDLRGDPYQWILDLVPYFPIPNGTTTETPTPSCTPTITPTPTTTGTPLAAQSASPTPTQTGTYTVAPQGTPSATVSPQPTRTCTMLPIHSPTATPTRTPIATVAGVTGAASPNPFRPGKGQTARFSLPVDGNPNARVIRIITIKGRVVRTLSGVQEWDGRDEQGRLCEGGLYLFRIEARDQRTNGTIVLLNE